MNKLLKNAKKWQIVLIGSLTSIIIAGAVVGIVVPLVNNSTYKRGVNLDNLKLDSQSIAWGAYNFNDAVNQTVNALNDKYNLNIKLNRDLKFKVFLNNAQVSEQDLNSHITQADFQNEDKISVELTAVAGSFVLKPNSHQTYEFKVTPLDFHSLKFNSIYTAWGLNSFQDISNKFITDNFGNSLNGLDNEYDLKLFKNGETPVKITKNKISKEYSNETFSLTIKGTNDAHGAILTGKDHQGSTTINVQKLDLTQLKSKLDLSSIQWLATYDDIQNNIIQQIKTLVAGDIRINLDILIRFSIDGKEVLPSDLQKPISCNNTNKDLQINITGASHSPYIVANSIILNKTIPKLNLNTINYGKIIRLSEQSKANLNGNDETTIIKTTVMNDLKDYIYSIDPSFKFSFHITDFTFSLFDGKQSVDISNLLNNNGKIYKIQMKLNTDNPFVENGSSFEADISGGYIDLSKIKIDAPEINFTNTYQKMIDDTINEIKEMIPDAVEGIDFKGDLYWDEQEQLPIEDKSKKISFNNLNKNLVLKISAKDGSEIFKKDSNCKISSPISKIDLSQPNALPNLTKYLNNSENFDANDSIASFEDKVTTELKKEVINNDNITDNLDLNLTQNQRSFTIRKTTFSYYYWSKNDIPIGAKDLQLNISIATGKTNNYFMNQTVYNVNVEPTLKFNDKIKTIFSKYIGRDAGAYSFATFDSKNNHFSDIIKESEHCLSDILPGTDKSQYQFNLYFTSGGDQPKTTKIDPKWWHDTKNELKINECLWKICDTDFEKDRGDKIEIEVQLKDAEQIGDDQVNNKFTSEVYVL